MFIDRKIVTSRIFLTTELKVPNIAMFSFSYFWRLNFFDFIFGVSPVSLLPGQVRSTNFPFSNKDGVESFLSVPPDPDSASIPKL